jgi:hypothetical protein
LGITLQAGDHQYYHGDYQQSAANHELVDLKKRLFFLFFRSVRYTVIQNSSRRGYFLIKCSLKNDYNKNLFSLTNALQFCSILPA